MPRTKPSSESGRERLKDFLDNVWLHSVSVPWVCSQTSHPLATLMSCEFAVSEESLAVAFTPGPLTCHEPHVMPHRFNRLNMSRLLMNLLSPLRAGVFDGTADLSKVKMQEKPA